MTDHSYELRSLGPATRGPDALDIIGGGAGDLSRTACVQPVSADEKAENDNGWKRPHEK
jgi:hypothetical protein